MSSALMRVKLRVNSAYSLTSVWRNSKTFKAIPRSFVCMSQLVISCLQDNYVTEAPIFYTAKTITAHQVELHPKYPADQHM